MISSAGLIVVFNKSILLLANYYSETICTRFVVPLYFGGDVCGVKRIDSGN